MVVSETLETAQDVLATIPRKRIEEFRSIVTRLRQQPEIVNDAKFEGGLFMDAALELSQASKAEFNDFFVAIFSLRDDARKSILHRSHNVAQGPHFSL